MAKPSEMGNCSTHLCRAQRGRTTDGILRVPVGVLFGQRELPGSPVTVPELSTRDLQNSLRSTPYSSFEGKIEEIGGPGKLNRPIEPSMSCHPDLIV